MTSFHESNSTKNTNIDIQRQLFLQKCSLFSHKYNLFQQFFIIGIEPKILYTIYSTNIKTIPEPLIGPVIITKYPNYELPYINIQDSMLISHCFPQGFSKKIKEIKNLSDMEKNYQENFIFSLDNQITIDKNSSLKINKIYYTCLLFYEKLNDYKTCIDIKKNNSNNNKNNTNDFINKNILIPKVICLSSFSPFYMETKSILTSLKQYIDYFHYSPGLPIENKYPIEKIIEGFIFNLPGLPRMNYALTLNKANSEKSSENIDNKYFSEIRIANTPPNKRPKIVVNYSFLMKFFRIEEIFEILKYIILEEPILFFCDDIKFLTYAVEGFAALIYPFEYQYPVVAVLPEKNYSFINIFNCFIFGINYEYSEELLKEKGIVFEKNTVIVRMELRFKEILNKNENDKFKGNSAVIYKKCQDDKMIVKLVHSQNEKNYGNLRNENIIFRNFNNNFKEYNKCIFNNEEDNIILSGDKLKLPIHYHVKSMKKLEANLAAKFKDIKINSNTSVRSSLIKQNISALEIEKERLFNIELTENIFYFFICITLHYQKYTIKFDISNKNYFRNEKIEKKFITDTLSIYDIFDVKGYINNMPSSDRSFYARFLETKLFFNFLKKKIFPLSVQDKLDILFFDNKINEKLSRESVSKFETKFIENNLPNMTGEINICSFRRLIDEKYKEFLLKKNNINRALNYFQFIKVKNPEENSDCRTSSNCNNDLEFIEDNKDSNGISVNFYYFVFPKLLFDGIFYKDYKIEQEENSSQFWTRTNADFNSKNCDCLYNQHDKEGKIIINDNNMTQNYSTYSYNINTNINTFWSLKEYIYILWIRLFAKIFGIIQNKKYCFGYLLNILNKNYDLIDNDSIIMVFNSVYKYGEIGMIGELYNCLKYKTYTALLFVKEKNNFTQKNLFIKNTYKNINEGNNNIENNNKLLDVPKINNCMNFNLNLYCNIKKGNKICNAPCPYELKNLFKIKEKYFSFPCPNCQSKSEITISCKYKDSLNENKNNNNNNDYIITVRLISPYFILKENYFEKSSEINLPYYTEQYLEYYLSALFYFHSEGLFSDFLLPEIIIPKQLTNETIKHIYNKSKVTISKYKSGEITNNTNNNNISVYQKNSSKNSLENIDISGTAKGISFFEISTIKKGLFEMKAKNKINFAADNKSSFKKRKIYSGKSVEFRVQNPKK